MVKRIGFFLLLLIGMKYNSGCSKEPAGIYQGDKVYPEIIAASHLAIITDTYVTMRSQVETLAGFIISDDGGGTIVSHGVCWGTTEYPTTSEYTFASKRSYSKDSHYHVAGLNASTTYYLRAFVTNSVGTAYGDQVKFTTVAYYPSDIFNPYLTYGSVSDADNNTYKTIQIGTQTWMAENLKTTKYNDGSQIIGIRWYSDDSSSYKDTYGALYTYYNANTGKLCPTGWHVPTDEEWKTLEMELGMTRASVDSAVGDLGYGETPFRGTDQGSQMKAVFGWNEWEGYFVQGTNTSGFSALPAGVLSSYGFEGEGYWTGWWSFGSSKIRMLECYSSKVARWDYYGNYGLSVRCLKD